MTTDMVIFQTPFWVYTGFLKLYVVSMIEQFFSGESNCLKALYPFKSRFIDMTSFLQRYLLVMSVTCLNPIFHHTVTSFVIEMTLLICLLITDNGILSTRWPARENTIRVSFSGG